ncbi:MAG TPA: shikimate kinase [Bacillota bacterium]|nr:shikimate kinase [Clostridiales bacterium]HPT85099.1 shikimate kinase [Bacillota bacterium]
MINQNGKIYGLVGRKLGHSYSAKIHAMLGNSAYRLYELEPEELGGFVRRPDIGALNVTIPYKIEVMRYLDEISPEAESIGSVNTVVRRDNRLYGFNTDFFGFDYMARRAGIIMHGKKVLIFGSGGSSQTVRACAKAAGASEIVVISRSGPDNYENIDRHKDAQILVNTTPVGMYPEPEGMLIDPGFFPLCEGVIDLIYNPLRTNFVLRASQLGIPHTGGLPMLVAQAVRAHELFFGVSVPLGEIERILSELGRSVENIVLVGMPGCGKTTTGCTLGKISGREVLDTDAMVEKAAEMSIPEIFARYGEAEFRAMEKKAVSEASMRSGAIIVTGGGVVKDEANYAPLKRNGRVYFLERPVEQLARKGRPLSENADLFALYAERLPLYLKFADARVNISGTPDEVAAKILEEFRENSRY